MKRFILPLAAALLLTGCTAGSPAAAPSTPAETQAVQVAATPEPSATPNTTPSATATPAPSKTADPAQAWADEKLELFISTAGAKSLKAWDKGTPERNIVSVDSPTKGVFRIKIADAKYDKHELQGMASDFMYRHGCAAKDLEKTIVETVSGSQSFSANNCS